MTNFCEDELQICVSDGYWDNAAGRLVIGVPAPEFVGAVMVTCFPLIALRQRGVFHFVSKSLAISRHLLGCLTSQIRLGEILF